MKVAIMAETIEVYTTIDSIEGAHQIASDLVSKLLAACVQVSGPITSIYWWQRVVEHSQEWVCTAKMRKALYQQVEEAIRKYHSYETPEILAVDVTNGNADYLHWIEQETNQEIEAV